MSSPKLKHLLCLLISFPFFITSVSAQQNCSGAGRVNPEYPNTSYITAPSWENDGVVVALLALTQFPHTLNQNILRTIQSTPNVKIDVRERFIYGFSNVVDKYCRNLGITRAFGEDFCPVILSAGIKQIPDSRGEINGRNTEALATRSRTLATATRPRSAENEAPEKDCNLDTVTVPGNEKVDTISRNLGTSTGFYREGLPSFERGNADFHDDQVEKRKDKDNLEIRQKMFIEDKRIPEVDIACKEFTKAFFPDGAGPCP